MKARAGRCRPDLIDRDKVPRIRKSLTADDFRGLIPSVTDALLQRVPGVATTDVQGNSFHARPALPGFHRLALQGTPQGLAVYMGGIRVNEAVRRHRQLDLNPHQCHRRRMCGRATRCSASNALGARSIRMKNGFHLPGL